MGGFDYNIVLIGFMGTGKSTVSEYLSARFAMRTVEMDQVIAEREKMSIPEIFAVHGEEYFRDQETAMLDELGLQKSSVVSCGGGMVLRELNIRKMRALGRIVLLTAAPETVYDRVKASTDRPLLQDQMNVDHIREMMEMRMPFYERAADICVVTDNRMICDIAREILDRI